MGDRQAGVELPGQLGWLHRASPTRTAANGFAGFPSASSKATTTARRFRATASTPATPLALWSAGAVQSLALEAFNAGEYYRAVQEEVDSQTVTKILYPNDQPEVGKQLRLLQQYFFVSCSLQDILHLLEDFARLPVQDLPDRVAIQLNDTHPSVAVAELMRLLMDERDLGWDEAWDITVATMAYTNHTLLPEALETWPLPMFAQFLPRHLEIIFEINRRFLNEVRAKFPGDDARVRRMSLIGEDGAKSVRMAHLATVGSHAINGVAALHSDLVKSTILKDFYEMWPERFSNKTNGVTPRRFVALSNPACAVCSTNQSAPTGWFTSTSCVAWNAMLTIRRSRTDGERSSERTNLDCRTTYGRKPASNWIRTGCSTFRSSGSTNTSDNTSTC